MAFEHEGVTYSLHPNTALRVREARDRPCTADAECNPAGWERTAPERRSLCEPHAHRCMVPLDLTASYAAAVNNYIAGGGSGFFVLQRNTTQVDTRVEQRDAVIGFVRQAPPCGHRDEVVVDRNRRRGVTDPAELSLPQRADDGLADCATDADCGDEHVCACAERTAWEESMAACTRAPSCAAGEGRCVLRQCRDDVRALVLRACPALPAADPRFARCACAAEDRAAMTCRILSCLDERTGAAADGRLTMVAR